MASFDYHILSLLSSTIFAIAIIVSYLYNQRKQITIRIRDENDARVLLSQSTLLSRAEPNQRLIKAFGIDNAFTTIDARFYKDFVFRVKGQLRMQDDDWVKTAINARKLVNDFKTKNATSQPLSSLENLVQNFVFRVVMKHFYPNVPEMSDFNVKYIASRINSTWVASKACSKSEDLLQVKIELFDKLTNVFGMHPALGLSDDQRNPLNILLPAYETLWRIVLLSLIEIHFRSNPSSESMRQLLAEFLDWPSLENFEKLSDDAGNISPRAIILESLRLYPPTRRIHRFAPPIRSPFELLSPSVIQFILRIFGYDLDVQSAVRHAIDVEYLHRNRLTWGHDALEYNPKIIKNMRRHAFLPFGKGTFTCPAEKTFAPIMIAICISALIEAFPVAGKHSCVGNESWKLVDENSSDVKFALGPLENGREGFPDLYLVRG